MVEGYLETCHGLFETTQDKTGILLHKKIKKVSIVTGGGAGNEPWVIGYVGRGLADGAAIGNVYTAPPPRSILNVMQQVYHKEGVLFLCTNHTGDVLTFELASDLAQLAGIHTKCLFVADDVSSAPFEKRDERRGVAGIALVMKIAGAASLAGLSLDEVYRITQKASKNIFTFGVTTSPGYLPSGAAMCTLPEGKIEYGMGFNGEPGISRTSLQPADKIADTVLRYLLEGSNLMAGDEIALMLNGYGFTSLLELCIVNRRLTQVLREKGFILYDNFIDSLFSPQGTGGFSVSILKLDSELKRYYKTHAYSPFFHCFEADGGKA